MSSFAAPAVWRSWKWTTLGEVAAVITGTTPPTKDPENYGDAVPFVKPTELIDRPIHSAPQGLSEVGLKIARTAPPGAVLVSYIGVLGKTGIARTQVAFNQQINAIVFNELVLPEFGLYYAQTLRPWLYGQASATTLPIVNKGKFQRAPFPLVPLEDQRRIVAEIEKQFSRLDEAVANLKRVTASLARYRAATLAEAFAVQPGWAISSYGEVGVVTTGFTPPTSDEANFGGAIPFFKPTDLDAGENVVAAREYLSDRGLSKGRLLPANSVLVTCIGATIGKTGLARVACATNQQINAVAPDPAKVDPRFLYWWTVSPRGQEQIVSNASATTLPILNKSKFSALPVPIPPIAEQHRIVAEVDRRLSIVREVDAEVDASLKRAQVLRQAVLSLAFG